MTTVFTRRRFLKSAALSMGALGLYRTVSAQDAPKSGAPNFIVIVSDDQSWCGSSLLSDPEEPDSKSDFYETPALERLAARGMRFTQGYSPAPFCCPTRRSLLIGQTPARHVYQKDQERWPAEYRKQLTIPRMLKAANPEYRTAHFGKWDFRTDRVTPEELGYDVSDGYTGNFTGGAKGTGGPSAQEDPKLIFGITERACAFMEQQVEAGKPFYVQVSHYAVHLDIFYRQESFDAWKTREPGAKHTMPEFAAMTEDMDTGIGILLDKVDALGLRDNTYVFFMSDNGGRLEMLGQEGKTQRRNYPLRDGKGSMYEGGIRVPFIAAGPGIEAGSVSRVPVTGLDFLPTLADYAGYPEPLPPVLDGGSMREVLSNRGRGTVRRMHPFLLFHHAVDRKPQTAIIHDDWKLVRNWDEKRTELFKLSEDLSEAKDLSGKNPEKTKELERMMTAFLTEVGADTGRQPE